MALLVTDRALRGRRRSLLAWTLGVTAYVTLMAAFYSSIQNSDVQDALDSYPDELKAFFGGSKAFDLSTFHGYLNVELYSLVVPALLVIAAVGFGAATLAGEQQGGMLDLLLAYPITRRRVVLEKALGVAAGTAALVVAGTAGILVVGALSDQSMRADHIAIASLGAWLLAVWTGWLAMLAGAATGSRGAAIGLPAAVFAASYLVVGVAGLVSWIEPLRFVSPLYHANSTTPLANGLPVVNYAVLVVLCAVTLAATVVVFERRDLTR
jgi:ABC-2 type transport system permease protein